MTENIIKIPAYVEGKEFYSSSLEDALRSCQGDRYEAQFMPAIVDARIEAPKGARIWHQWYTTPSLECTGRTKQGNAVVIYAHVPNYFSNPDNIREAKQKGLISGAGIVPQDEFQRLLDLEDNKNVFIIDYEKIRNSGSGIIKLRHALKHAQTIPFLGGIERAERYLERHEEVYGSQIGIWHSPEDLHDVPLGRLLFLGYDLYDCDGLLGFLDGSGRFVGVRKSAEGATQKSLGPSLENLLKLAGEFIPTIAKKEFEQRLKAIYREDAKQTGDC